MLAGVTVVLFGRRRAHDALPGHRQAAEERRAWIRQREPQRVLVHHVHLGHRVVRDRAERKIVVGVDALARQYIAGVVGIDGAVEIVGDGTGVHRSAVVELHAAAQLKGEDLAVGRHRPRVRQPRTDLAGSRLVVDDRVEDGGHYEPRLVILDGLRIQARLVGADRNDQRLLRLSPCGSAASEGQQPCGDGDQHEPVTDSLHLSPSLLVVVRERYKNLSSRALYLPNTRTGGGPRGVFQRSIRYSVSFHFPKSIVQHTSILGSLFRTPCRSTIVMPRVRSPAVSTSTKCFWRSVHTEGSSAMDIVTGSGSVKPGSPNHSVAAFNAAVLQSRAKSAKVVRRLRTRFMSASSSAACPPAVLPADHEV